MLINQYFSVDRMKYIGGSDIGAILGLSKFRSPLEVWMEKTGKESKQKDSLPLRFGSFAEEFVASEYVRSTGSEVLHDQSAFIHPLHPMFCAHLDRLVLGDGLNCAPTKILECKTANPFTSGDWGDIGSDEVPMTYLCQVAWYQAITRIGQADLAVLFGNSDFRIYAIARDLELEELIVQKANTRGARRRRSKNEYQLRDCCWQGSLRVKALWKGCKLLRSTAVPGSAVLD